MRRILKAVLLGGAVLGVAWAGLAGAAELISRGGTPRGEMIDIGGRKLRLVCEGPRSDAPVVWMEAGAFSGAADFAAVQDSLAARGIRSCAYDRAGMGYSPPGPAPRDGDAILQDLERLVAASQERGPFILLAHSMGGLYLRQFAVRHPDKVAGVVLVEAVTPEMFDNPRADQFIGTFILIARTGAVTGSLGLTKPLYWFGDRIGLPADGKREKRRGFISGRQSRTALNEVLHWRQAAAQARREGGLDPAWPVAVITAGPPRPWVEAWNPARQAPAKASAAGFIDNVDEATHASVLGEAHAARVVAGVIHVLTARGAGPAASP